MNDNSSQNPIPYSSEPEALRAETLPRILSLKGSTSKRYLKRLKYLTLLKIVTKEEISSDERNEMIYLKDRIQGEYNSQFIRSHLDEIKNLFHLNEIILYGDQPSEGQYLLAEIVIRDAEMDFNLGCAFWGWHLSNPPQTLLMKRSPYSRKSRKARTRYIGVGYRDQGNMKNVAYDGCPNWQECAGLLYEVSPPDDFHLFLQRKLYGEFYNYPGLDL